MFLCIVKETKPNICISITDESPLNVKQIKENQKIEDNYLLILYTPNYRRVLNDDEVPVEIEPNLKLTSKPERYPPPSYFLKSIPKNEDNFVISLGIQIKTQSDIEFPTMFVPITEKEMETFTAASFLAKCSQTFGYDCNQQELLSIDGEIIDNNTKIDELIEESKKGNLIYSCNLSDSALKPIKHRINLCEQIIDSESFYVSSLQLILSYFQPAITNARIFNDDQGSEIFKNISPILHAHTLFLNYLQQEKLSFKKTITDGFLNFVPYFKVSSSFISNYKNIDAYITEKMKNKTVSKTIKEIEEHIPDGSNRTFMQCYVMPIQRYPKYTLLLRDIDKKTPKFHPDKEYMHEALEALTTVNGSFDVSSFKMNQTYLMNKIQKEIGPVVKLLIPRRILLVSTEIKFIEQSISTNDQVVNDSHTLHGFVHLFNDMLMITEKSRKSQSIHLMHPLNRLHYQILNNDTYCFIENQKQYIITILDQDDKATFNEKLMPTIQESFRDIESKNLYVTWELSEETEFQISKTVGCVVNGRAIFFGGRDQAQDLVTDFYKYNIETKEWAKEHCDVTPRWMHTLTSLGTNAYVAFGKSQVDMLNDIWKFDQIKGIWQKIEFSKVTNLPISNEAGSVQTNQEENVPMKRCGHSCVAWGDKLIFFGGMTLNQKFTDKVSIFDTKTLEFSDVETKYNPGGRFNHSATIYKNKMIVVAGNAGKQFCSNYDILDLETMEWSYVEVKPDPHYLGMGFSLIQYGRYAYLFGGVMAIKYIQPYAIDLETLQAVHFEQFGNNPKVFVDAGLVISDNKAYAFGGRESPTGGKVLKSLYVIDFESGYKDLHLQPATILSCKTIEPTINEEQESSTEINEQSQTTEEEEKLKQEEEERLKQEEEERIKR